MELMLILFALVLFVAVLICLIWRRRKPSPKPRSVVVFDLSRIPVDATIISATLTVSCGAVAENIAKPRLVREPIPTAPGWSRTPCNCRG